MENKNEHFSSLFGSQTIQMNNWAHSSGNFKRNIRNKIPMSPFFLPNLFEHILCEYLFIVTRMTWNIYPICWFFTISALSFSLCWSSLFDFDCIEISMIRSKRFSFKVHIAFAIHFKQVLSIYWNWCSEYWNIFKEIFFSCDFLEQRLHTAHTHISPMINLQFQMCIKSLLNRKVKRCIRERKKSGKKQIKLVEEETPFYKYLLTK